MAKPDELKLLVEELISLDFLIDLQFQVKKIPSIIELLVQISYNSGINYAFYLIEKEQTTNQSILEVMFELAQQNQEYIIKWSFYTLIGNIALEGVHPRDKVFQLNGLFDIMIYDLNLNFQNQENTLAEQILWSLSCLLNEEPIPEKQILNRSYQVCQEAIKSINKLKNDEFQHILLSIKYLTSNSASLSRKTYKDFSDFLNECINSGQKQLIQHSLDIWVNLTCKLKIEQLFKLIAKQQLVGTTLYIIENAKISFNRDQYLSCIKILSNLFVSNKDCVQNLLLNAKLKELLFNIDLTQVSDKILLSEILIMRMNIFKMAYLKDIYLLDQEYQVYQSLPESLSLFVSTKEVKIIFRILNCIKSLFSRCHFKLPSRRRIQEDIDEVAFYQILLVTFKSMDTDKPNKFQELLTCIINDFSYNKKVFSIAIEIEDLYLKDSDEQTREDDENIYI